MRRRRRHIPQDPARGGCFPWPKNAPRRGLFRPAPPLDAALFGEFLYFCGGLFLSAAARLSRRAAAPLRAKHICPRSALQPAAARLSRRATVPLCKQKIRARSADTAPAATRSARKKVSAPRSTDAAPQQANIFLPPRSTQAPCRQPTGRAPEGKKSAPEAPTPRPRCGCVFLQTEKQRLRMPMQRRCFDRGTDGLMPAVADKSETTRKERLFRIPPFTIRFGFSSCTSGKSRRRSEGRRLSFFGFQCFSDIPKSFSRLNRNLRFLTFCDIPSVKLSVHENFLFFYRIATPSCFEDSLFPLP